MLRLISYDMKCGFNSNIKKIIFFVVLIITYNFIGQHEISEFSSNYGIKPDILDYYCYVLGGPKFIPENMLKIYQIPVMWLMIQIMIAYVVGYYAITDLHRYGQHVLLRSSSRLKWLGSKIIWNMFTVILMYLIVFGITFLNGYISGAEFKWKLTEEICVGVCNLNFIPDSRNVVYIFLFVMPLIISLAISVLQMVIALITSPIIGFVVSQSITFLGTIYTTKAIISNYAMLSHSKYTCYSDIEYFEGIVIGFMVIVISILVGGVYFNHCDILPKNKDV